MKKYRIVSTSNHNLTDVTYYIEHKKWYGWVKIEISDNNVFKLLSFNSYEDAEQHMKNNYFLDGKVIKPYPNVYYYQERQYYGY